jgi:hypothetical protein
MIKFFRKIRQRLLSENKLSKYLIYAIGEIILVVIGILIALQINNWNENVKLESKTTHLIQRLTIELNRDIENIKYRIDFAENINRSTTALMNKFGDLVDEKEHKEIDSLLSWTTLDYDLTFQLNSLLEARDNGEISLIKSDSLRTKLYEFITLGGYIKEREKILNDDKNNFLVPFLYKNVNRRNMKFRFKEFSKEKIGFSNLPIADYVTLFRDREFENMLNERFIYSKERIITYEYVQSFLNELKKMLEAEIKK